jgi:hypothetical protein
MRMKQVPFGRHIVYNPMHSKRSYACLMFWIVYLAVFCLMTWLLFGCIAGG